MADETVQMILNDLVNFAMTKERKPHQMIKKLIEIASRYDNL